ncbi:MAG: hypothetical protein H7Z11_15125 [Verrucomicrobia bacterium]|nr:hypothetical protein [Leptolyngbya sp. ES-bin-22]
MKGKQLELNLWEALRRAQQMPKTVEVIQILDAMDVAAAQLPDTAQLQFAGEALLQIAELCAARATVLMTEWEESYRDPIVAQGFFADVVRQTMTVDLSDLMAPAPPRKPRTQRAKSTETEVGSLASPVDKAVLLAMVDQLESEATLEEGRKQQVLAIAYEEQTSRWIEAIAQWLEAVPTHQTSFAHLCQNLGLPRVEIWLGVLLGEFELEPDESFYSDALQVKAAAVRLPATTATSDPALDACQN